MSLIHRLVVGYFDLSVGRQFVCTRPLDMERARQRLLNRNPIETRRFRSAAWGL